MIKLYLKTIAAVILLLCFILSGYYLGLTYLITESVAEINRLLSKGAMSYIQSVLIKNPQAEWEPALKKIQPTGSNSAKIIPIDSLHLSAKNKELLMAGKIIFLQSKNYIFLYSVIVEHFAIQRIGGSDYALQLELGDTINNIVNQTMRFIVHIISLQIENVPTEQQLGVLENLQSRFGMPLQLLAANSEAIPQEIRQRLKTSSLVLLPARKNQPIDTLYFRISIPNKILVISPIKYAPVSQRFSDMQRSYFPSFAIFSILIVVFLTWLFSRNVLKIYQLTRSYSHGDFSKYTNISHLSVLKGVHENVVAMGNNLKLLMQSQHNTVRFVAHEIRTPLSTMQLALDTSNKQDGLSDLLKQNLASIQEDIQDLNKLMSYFLLYSQSASHELKLKKKSLCLHEWLEKLIKRYQSSPINITLVDLKNEKMKVNFDPNLLKHVVDNLLTNALKFANKEVMVSLELSNHNVMIHVDDDGPGISREDRANVFQPFVTLNSNQAFGKHIGLGLNIANAIVELHRGSITVTESPLLGGSRFTIQFPIKS